MDFEFIPNMNAHMFTCACNDCSDFVHRFTYASDGTYVVTFKKGTATITIEHYATEKVTVILEDRFINTKVSANMVEGECNSMGLHLRVTTEYKEVLNMALMR